ncbi:hypothetical protein G6L08_08500 [Agrobacterium rhizogenes]|nr:hypothetical protein [Rhizobium rhizogenes]
MSVKVSGVDGRSRQGAEVSAGTIAEIIARVNEQAARRDWEGVEAMLRENEQPSVLPIFVVARLRAAFAVSDHIPRYVGHVEAARVRLDAQGLNGERLLRGLTRHQSSAA